MTLSHDFQYLVFHQRMDSGGSGGGVDQMPLSPKGVPAVDEPYRRTEAGEIERVLQGGIASAHYGDLFSLEKTAVTGGAVAYAPPRQGVLAGHIQLSAADSVGQDDGPPSNSAPAERTTL